MRINDYEIRFSFKKFALFDYASDNANKFIHNEHTISIQLCWLCIMFTVHNYNKIIHCILDEDEDYCAPQQLHLIKVLCEVLRLAIVKSRTMYTFESDYFAQTLPFDFNYIVKDNGHILYYITAENNFFTLHNLGALTTHVFPDCYMSKEQIEYYFRPYTKKHEFEEIKPMM